MKVFTRYELVDRSLRRDEPALLLEGSWPRDHGGPRWSLDDSVDARHAWIDAEAARIAENLAGDISSDKQASLRSDTETVAFLNALKLRYFLVKLLRWVALFADVAPPPDGGSYQLWAAAGDDDYQALFDELCRIHHVAGIVRMCPGQVRPDLQLTPTTEKSVFDWRRAAAAVNGWTMPQSGRHTEGGQRIIFRGNRRLLGDVCAELVVRGAKAWWLYDRFAVKTWLKWRARGVGQLVCDTGNGRQSRFGQCKVARRISCRGIDLTRPIRQWLDRAVTVSGDRQARMLDAIDRHFTAERPQKLILDEDATPFARAAVLVARRHGVKSIVLQHGVPCVRFGFAPLAADRIFTWGEPSSRQLSRWGVPEERIQTVGFSSPAVAAPRVPGGRCRKDSSRGVNILLLACVPPRSDRPDAVSFHLTQRTHARMLHMACAAVGRIPDARLLVKPHPRDRNRQQLQGVLAEYPKNLSRIVSASNLGRLLGGVDCVLSCASGAGIESTLTGVPVIQLMPAGSADLLPACEWGLLGTVRGGQELDTLLRRALSTIQRSPSSNNSVFASLGRAATVRIADAILRGSKADSPSDDECSKPLLESTAVG